MAESLIQSILIFLLFNQQYAIFDPLLNICEFPHKFHSVKLILLEVLVTLSCL